MKLRRHVSLYASLLFLAGAITIALTSREEHKHTPECKHTTVGQFPDEQVETCRKIQSSIVTIKAGKFGGSGFCQRLPDGSVAVWTAAHILTDVRVPNYKDPDACEECLEEDGPPTFKPVTIIREKSEHGKPSSKHEWQGEIVRYNRHLDVALIIITENVPPDFLQPLDFVANLPSVGEPVLCGGSPKLYHGSITTGIVSFVGRRLPAEGSPKFMDQVSSAALHGNSGGPVCDARGNVLGIVCCGPGENVIFIVPARVIREWGTAHGLTFSSDSGRLSQSRGDLHKTPIESK